jgi:hypothetical protein
MLVFVVDIYIRARAHVGADRQGMVQRRMAIALKILATAAKRCAQWYKYVLLLILLVLLLFRLIVRRLLLLLLLFIRFSPPVSRECRQICTCIMKISEEMSFLVFLFIGMHVSRSLFFTI